MHQTTGSGWPMTKEAANTNATVEAETPKVTFQRQISTQSFYMHILPAGSPPVMYYRRISVHSCMVVILPATEAEAVRLSLFNIVQSGTSVVGHAVPVSPHAPVPIISRHSLTRELGPPGIFQRSNYYVVGIVEYALCLFGHGIPESIPRTQYVVSEAIYSVQSVRIRRRATWRVPYQLRRLKQTSGIFVSSLKYILHIFQAHLVPELSTHDD
jgi:hypothetical protein